MPRKKSVGGRAKSSTPVNKLILQTQKVNRRLNQLERAGVYAKYSGKRLVRFANESRLVSYKRSRKEKIRIPELKKLTPAEIRLVEKTFNRFLKSKTGSAIGLIEVRDTTKATLKQTLKNYKGDIDDEDVEDFYDFIEDDDFRYFADKIGDSQLYALIEEAKEKNYTEKRFIETLEQYLTINNADIRKRAQRLYNKYVAGI